MHLMCRTIASTLTGTVLLCGWLTGPVRGQAINAVPGGKSAAAATIEEPADASPIDFEKEIRPLLRSRCGACHGDRVQKGGLRLDVRHTAFHGGDGGAVIQPGQPEDSELLRRINSSDSSEWMPPEGERIPQPERELLRRWIEQGAVWPETDEDRAAAVDPRLQHWAYQPLRKFPAENNDPESSESPEAAGIDAFVRQRLSDQGLSMSPEADRTTLIRRLSLDLLGLPPTPEMIAEFVADPDPQAWERLVDRFLSSPHYGERWAQHWLDVVRYADTHGFEVNTPRDNAWPYRDYIIRSLNEDKPYDQMIREQLAGDVLQADEATGFLVAAAALLPGQIGADPESMRLARQDALDEIVVGTGATFLGMTLGCARCHDHKFDPVTTRDYYSFQAFFSGVEYGDRPIRSGEFLNRQQEARKLGPRIEQLDEQLRQFAPVAFTGDTRIIDEADSGHTVVLKTPNGPGVNPDGAVRGYRDDPGSAAHVCNLSGGRYTWWDNKPGEDVLAYYPRVTGRYRLWLSWGAHGSGVHTRDARYVLDADGDLQTRDDQQEIARIDQYYLAGMNSGVTEQKPLWSGLQEAGVRDWNEQSCLIVRGGDTGTGITADVIVLQQDTQSKPPADGGRSAEEAGLSSAAENDPTRFPRLRQPVNPRHNEERFVPVAARFVRLTTSETINQNQHEPCIDELEIFAVGDRTKNLALAGEGARASSSGNLSETGIHQLKHINDGRYGNERSWISDTRGGGWVQIELGAESVIDTVVWSRDRNGKFQDRLPVRYDIQVSRDGTEWQIVAGSSDRISHIIKADATAVLQWNQPEADRGRIQELVSEITELRQRRAEREKPQLVYAGTFRTPDKAFVLRRGDPEQPQDQVQPEVPGLFGPLQQDSVDQRTELTEEQQRRLRLARWIASAEHPLTARVMVNRVWNYHFGRGLVDTPNDFGINGSSPSHPELLDWLAGQFIRSGWSLKRLHRLIVHSAAYRQSHQVNAEAAAIDRDNRLLWHFAARRLEAECIRDSILAVTGELNLQMGGQGFNLFRARGGLDGFPPVEDFTPAELRRMVYAHKVRMEQVPVFGAFDCPDAGQSMPSRGQSTTAIQALNLLNSPFMIDRSERFAARIQADAADDVPAQIQRGFLLAFGRRPSDQEASAAKEVARQYGLASVCRALLNSSEFLMIP